MRSGIKWYMSMVPKTTAGMKECGQKLYNSNPNLNVFASSGGETVEPPNGWTERQVSMTKQ